MVSCPQCECANPDRAMTCGRCGAALSGLAGALTVPLPARMTEPVLTPVPGAPDDEGVFPSHFALSSEDEDALPPPAKPRRDARHDPHSTHAGDELRVYVTTGAPLARTEQPDLPMNESVAQAGNATIPATAPADQSPPVPPPPSIRPKLLVLRGMKVNVEYPIYEGRNSVGRFADKPVDIDLVSQESNEQIWCSRQHAIVVFDKESVLIEDLNSLNGTWVNGVRIHAGQPKQLRPGDVVQIGTVQMKLILG